MDDMQVLLAMAALVVAVIAPFAAFLVRMSNSIRALQATANASAAVHNTMNARLEKIEEDISEQGKEIAGVRGELKHMNGNG